MSVKIYAEIGSCWFDPNPDIALENALEAINQVKICGADGVKFQLFRACSLYSEKRASDIYNKIDRSTDSLKEYASILRVYQKISREKPISNTQYIEYSNQLTAIEKERNETSKNARLHIKEFMEKLCIELKSLINDMQGPRNIIANPQNRIILDTEIEGEKKINGKKVFDAFSIIYNYAMALIYRLSPEGDLYRGLEFKEGEKKYIDSKIYDDKLSQRKRTKNAPEGSIIGELEDFI